MPSYSDRNELIKMLSNQAYFDALNKPKDPAKAIQVVGKDGQTGRSLLSHPDGGVTSNGVQRFNTAVPSDGFVAARIDRNSNAIAIDGRQRRETGSARILEEVKEYPIIKLENSGLIAWDGSDFLRVTNSGITRIDTQGEEVIEQEFTVPVNSFVIGYSVNKQETYFLDNYNVLIVKDNAVIATIAIPPPVGSLPYPMITSAKYVESEDKLYLGVIERIPLVFTAIRSIRIVDLVAQSSSIVEVFVNNRDGGFFGDNFNLLGYGDNKLLFSFAHVYVPLVADHIEVSYYYNYGFLEEGVVTMYSVRSQLDTFTLSGSFIGTTYYAFTSASIWSTVYDRSVFSASTEDFLSTIIYRDNPTLPDTLNGVASVNAATITNHPELSYYTIFTDTFDSNIYGVNYNTPATLIEVDARTKKISSTLALPITYKFAESQPYIIYCEEIDRIYIAGRVEPYEDADAEAGKVFWLIPYEIGSGGFEF